MKRLLALLLVLVAVGSLIAQSGGGGSTVPQVTASKTYVTTAIGGATNAIATGAQAISVTNVTGTLKLSAVPWAAHAATNDTRYVALTNLSSTLALNNLTSSGTVSATVGNFTTLFATVITNSAQIVTNITLGATGNAGGLVAFSNCAPGIASGDLATVGQLGGAVTHAGASWSNFAAMGSTYTYVPRFANAGVDDGAGVFWTITTNAANGIEIAILTNYTYVLSIIGNAPSGGQAVVGFSENASTAQLQASIASLNDPVLMIPYGYTSSASACIAATTVMAYLTNGTVIHPHVDSTTCRFTNSWWHFKIKAVGR